MALRSVFADLNLILAVKVNCLPKEIWLVHKSPFARVNITKILSVRS